MNRAPGRLYHAVAVVMCPCHRHGRSEQCCGYDARSQGRLSLLDEQQFAKLAVSAFAATRRVAGKSPSRLMSPWAGSSALTCQGRNQWGVEGVRGARWWYMIEDDGGGASGFAVLTLAPELGRVLSGLGYE